MHRHSSDFENRQAGDIPIPFTRPSLSGSELQYLSDVIAEGSHLHGGGAFTQRCQEWLQVRLGSRRALLTQSGTAALEMSCLLAGIGPGDEVIMPSYTFVSTANAFVLRGGIPVFVDIRRDTLNLDEDLVEEAITEGTRAIVAVHYGGQPCHMETLSEIARRHNVLLIEDAAQALLSTWSGREAGTIGDLGCISFHATKNLTSGEGGALLVNNPELVDRAEILWEKGTDRSRFIRGEVDRYSWVDVGSSFLPSELTGAFLFAQLERAEAITSRRVECWEQYRDGLADLAETKKLQLQWVLKECKPNGHLFCLRLPSAQAMEDLKQWLSERGIVAATHYVPLHSSPAGRRFGRCGSGMKVTDQVARTLLRLPMYADLTSPQIERVCACVRDCVSG